MAAGRDHTVINTDQGRVLTFGLGKYGQLGHGGVDDEILPREVEGLVGMKVLQVAAGGVHTVICSCEGDVWTFGNGEYGQLGHPGRDNELVPRRVEGLVGVVQVSADLSHTMVCTSEGTLLTFGNGTFFGECGQMAMNDDGSTDDEMGLREVQGIAGLKVVQVSSDGDHTVMCTSEGQVLTYGAGEFGQLGHGGTRNEIFPTRVESLVNMKVSQVSAGTYHTVVCTSEGLALSFGSGEFGKLGHGSDDHEMVPRLFDHLVRLKVTQISGGFAHTVLCTSEGLVLTFGSGRSGQLGHGNEENRMVPRIVKGLLV